MVVRVLFCPVCGERTPHESRLGPKLVTLASLAALACAALAWTLWVDAPTGVFALVVVVVLALRGLERRFRFIACTRCREHARERYRRSKPDLRHTIFGGP